MRTTRAILALATTLILAGCSQTGPSSAGSAAATATGSGPAAAGPEPVAVAAAEPADEGPVCEQPARMRVVARARMARVVLMMSPG